MTGKTTKFSSVLISELPFQLQYVAQYEDFCILKDSHQKKYFFLAISAKDFSTYQYLTGLSNHVAKSIYELKKQDTYYLLFDGVDEQTELSVKERKMLPIMKEIFQNSSYEITFKKEHFKNLNNLYKLLDNKFSYLEMRIREVETAPKKDDLSWMILSMYNVLLDVRIYLYDLQQDIFKAIDKQEIVKYGLIYRQIQLDLYHKGRILPYFDLYYAPLGMLYARYYLCLSDTLELERFKQSLDKEDTFTRKYFGFIVLYVLILNLNLEVRLHHFSVASYLGVVKELKKFLKNFATSFQK